MADQLQSLQTRLGVTFTDLTVLRTALVHRSYLNENRSFDLPHNERLEYLGDAVLELIVTDHLYRTYDNPEGDLTSWRSALVRGDMLAVVAVELGLGQALMMSRGEEKSGGRERAQLLANACESVIGAIYLDQGYDAAKEFVHRVLLPKLPDIISEGSDRDPKSSLQEVAQEKYNQTPQYSVTSESGPDHDKRFTVEVKLGDTVIGSGKGTSKQTAQQDAADNALKGKKFS